MQVQLKTPAKPVQMQSRPAAFSMTQDKIGLKTCQPQFGFLNIKPKELLVACLFIGLEKSARLLNIVTFGKMGLKNGEKIKFTIL